MRGRTMNIANSGPDIDTLMAIYRKVMLIKLTDERMRDTLREDNVRPLFPARSGSDLGSHGGQPFAGRLFGQHLSRHPRPSRQGCSAEGTKIGRASCRESVCQYD